MSLPKLAMPMNSLVMSNLDESTINNDDHHHDKDKDDPPEPPTVRVTNHPTMHTNNIHNNNNSITMISSTINNITTFMTPFKSLNNSFNKNLGDPLPHRRRREQDTIPFGEV